MTLVERKIKRRKKIRPGLITLQAKEREPIKDKSSRLVHLGRLYQRSIEVSKDENLSEGRRMIIPMESISIPRKTNC